jgi:hypothetical protein
MDAAAKSSKKQAAELENLTDAEKRRANALKLSNELFAKSITAFAGSTSPLAAYREEIDKIDKAYTDLIKGQTDVGLIQNAEAARLDRVTNAYKKFNDALGDRNSFLSAINNGAAFSVQVKKLTEDISEFNKKQEIAGRKENSITDKEKNDLIQDLGTKLNATVISFQEIDAPVLKYNRLLAEAAKVTDNLGNKLDKIDPSLIEKYKKSLGQSYTDAIDPVQKYNRVLSDLRAQVKLGIITDEQASAYIQTLSKNYRDIIDPIGKYRDILREVMAVPGLSDEDAQKYFKTLGDSFRSVIDDSVELKNRLKEVDAATKGGLGKIITPEEADAIKTQLQLNYDLNKAGKEAALINSDKAKADVEYLKTLNDINLAFGKQGENLSKVTERTMAVNQAQAKWMQETIPYFKDIVGFTQSFADGLANAIVAGQSFGDALRNVFQDVLKQIAVLIIRTTILQAIMASIGLVSAPAALAFGNLTGIAGKAAGGPVTGGTAYRVGEAGVETFVPSQNGYILPNGMSGKESTQVVQNIYVQTGVAQTVRAEMMQLLPSFKQQAIAGVLESKQRGGSYSRGLAAA